MRDSVAQALLLAAENRRLTAELQASLEEVRESRTRILTASDDTRRRIERDLHDGAQQLLISTGIKLNLAAVQAQRGDAETLAQVLEEAQASSTAPWARSAAWQAGSRRRRWCTATSTTRCTSWRSARRYPRRYG